MYNFSKKEKCYSLFGHMFGDGYYSNGTIRIAHTAPQREYVVWMENLYKIWGCFQNSRYDYLGHTTYGDFLYSSVSVKVPSRRHFENNRFYRNRIRILSTYALRRITPLGLLLWYMDDGTLSVHKKYKENGKYSVSRFGVFNTQGYTKEDNNRAASILGDRFGIDLRVHKDGIYYKLYMSAASFRTFYDLISPHIPGIPECMKYKFDMKYIPNRIKQSVVFAEKYNII